jgi:hypothetical protein
VRVADLSQFPASGWLHYNGQLISYTGRSGSAGEGALTGVPASGVGSIVADVTADVQINAQAYVTLSPGTVYAVNDGDTLALWCQRDDVPAQTALAALIGGTGIRVKSIRNSALDTIAKMNAAGDAYLVENSTAIKTITFETRDKKCIAGATVTANYSSPTSVTGTFIIQTVQITELGWFQGGVNPLRTCVAAPVRKSFDKFMQQIQLGG